MLKLRHAALLCLGLSAPALLRAQQTISVGSAPANMYSTIQQGINAASPGDTVLVAAGTYLENIDFKGKAISVTSTNILAPSATIIDGSGAGPVVTITGVTGAQLYGFTLQNGGKPQSANGPQGGVYLSNAVADIEDNIFVKNFCAGINATGSAVKIAGNDISQTLTPTGCTSAEGLGSGVAATGSYNGSSNVTLIVGNTIHNNTASVSYNCNGCDKGGGGAVNITGMPFVTLAFNKMYANATTGYGGAFYIANTPQLSFLNNLVYGNRGVSGGLDIVVPGKSVGPLVGIIANNTIADNTAVGSNAGSDIYISGNIAQYALVNNIVVGYTSGQVAVNCGVTYKDQASTPIILDHNDFYSVVGSGNTPIGGFCTTPPTQLGNFSKDPLFVHGTAADVAGTSGNTVDFSLQPASPAIDTGNNSAATVLGTDIASNPRIANGGTGGLSYPVVDMGAYELPQPSGIVIGSVTTIALSPSSYTPASGGPVTLTASIYTSTRGGSFTIPTGSVTFMEDYAVVGSGVITANGAVGTATFTLTNLTAGLHNLQAIYAGQGAFPPGISIYVTISATVGITTPTKTIMSSSQNPSTIGQTVTFTANVSSTNGVPAGSMIFSADQTTLATIAVDSSGNASYPISNFTANSHIVTATFQPSGTLYGSSSASLTQVVNGFNTTSTLNVSPTNPNYGDPVTLTAVVTPVGAGSNPVAPAGTLSFYDGFTGLATVTVVNGVGTFTTKTLTGGPHQINCIYFGDTNYNGSNCNTVAINVALTPATLSLSSSANPAFALTPFTVTASLSANGQPLSGTVTVTIDGVAQPNLTADAAGHATFTLSLPFGSHFIDAHSVATSNFASTEGTLTEQVVANPTSMTLIASPTPGYQNQNIAVTTTLLDITGASSPNGSITLFDGTTPLATLPTPATTPTNKLTSVTFNVATLALGNHTLSASYAPADANFLATTSGTQTLTILPQDITLTTSVPSTTIQTEHHGTLTITVNSLGFWSGNVNLTCGPTLPPVLQCTFAQPSLSVPANGSVSTTILLETDAIANFVSLDRAHTQRDIIAFATLLPLALLGLTRKRRFSRAVVLSTLCALFSALCLIGCSGKYPDHTPPGTYDIALTASGTAAGASSPTTKTIHVMLVVTP